MLRHRTSRPARNSRRIPCTRFYNYVAFRWGGPPGPRRVSECTRTWVTVLRHDMGNTFCWFHLRRSATTVAEKAPSQFPFALILERVEPARIVVKAERSEFIAEPGRRPQPAIEILIRAKGNGTGPLGAPRSRVGRTCLAGHPTFPASNGETTPSTAALRPAPMPTTFLPGRD